MKYHFMIIDDGRYFSRAMVHRTFKTMPIVIMEQARQMGGISPTPQ
ncbi:MAG: hypothetical protein IPN82_16115 [Chitinophagaceae bacterium]|nr:hypothetical protein [Chitinophagaceae bacterium]